MNAEMYWVIFAVFCVISFILRELACWYWKINASLGVLCEIRDLLLAQQKQQAELTRSLVTIKQDVKIKELPQEQQPLKHAKPLEPKAKSTDDLPFELQKGRCPNCDYVEAMSSIYCTRCSPRVRFGNSERWKLDRI